MFTISVSGTKEGVIKAIKGAKTSPEEKVCQKQIEAAKAYLIAEVNALPAECNGARVDATGQFHAGGRTLQSSVLPLKLHV